MEDKLKSLLKELVFEFEKDKGDFLINPRLYYAIKRGEYAGKGSKRIGGHLINIGICFELSRLHTLIGRYIQKYDSSKRIYEYVAQNKFWPTQYESYEDSLRYGAPMIDTVAGGFLCRNFEINNHQFIITNESFEIAYSELRDFFKRDYVSCDWYIHLQGVLGEPHTIKLTNEVTIVKAGFELAKFFSINYGNDDGVSLNEVFEDDYLLKIKIRRPKADYNFKLSNRIFTSEQSLLNKWKEAVLLGIPGYINFGKQIKLSADWPIINLRAMGPYGIDKWFPFSNELITLKESDVKRLKQVAKVIGSVDIQKSLDKKITHSLERLAKAKASLNIDDKVVELAMAWEFLLPTINAEVNMQLRLKLIKLLFDVNKDEQIYKKLTKFYDLRSKIVHGNDKVKPEDKTKEIIAFTENLIQRACLKLIDLTQKHNMNEIQDVLSSSLHLSTPFSQLLKTRL